MAGGVVWTVLMSRRVAATMALYEGALGWRFEPLSGAPYQSWVAKGANGQVLSVFLDTARSDFPAAPELWLPCLGVTNLDRRINEAEKLGATLLRPPLEIPKLGTVALLRQPGGAIVGWMDPSPEGVA